MSDKDAEGLRLAHRIISTHAKTFYLASRFLPRERRRAAFVIYAVCRRSDDAVDLDSGGSAAERITAIGRSIDAAYSDTGELTDPLLSVFRQTVRRYRIPKELFDKLLQGMRQDLTQKRYQTFQELSRYCYLAAGVIGLMTLKVLGCEDEEAKTHAVELGFAFQLTNILRDVREDCDRGRIYLPLEELGRFGVTEDDVSSRRLTPGVRALFAFQAERARSYYAAAYAGIKYLPDRRSRFVVTAMLELYRAILDAIEHAGFDVFSRRVSVSRFRKLCIITGIIGKGTLP